MEVLLQTYYTILPILTTALMGWVGILLRDQRKKEKELENSRKANSRGIMLVLRYMLKRYHSEYVLQGKITYNQYKDWIDIYETYRLLNGNSIACEWNEDVEKLEKCDSASEISIYEAMLRQNMKSVR